MRNRSPAQMPASSPPAAARTSMMTSFSSLGSRGTSIRRSLCSRAAASASRSRGHGFELGHHPGVHSRRRPARGPSAASASAARSAAKACGHRLQLGVAPARLRRSGCGRRSPPGRPGRSPPGSSARRDLLQAGEQDGVHQVYSASRAAGTMGPRRSTSSRSAGVSEASRLATATSTWSSLGLRGWSAPAARCPGRPGSAASAGRRRS